MHSNGASMSNKKLFIHVSISFTPLRDLFLGKKKNQIKYSCREPFDQTCSALRGLAVVDLVSVNLLPSFNLSGEDLHFCYVTEIS